MFNHVGLCTTDLDRATRFYGELFGLEVERDLEVPDEQSAELLGVAPPVGLRARYLRKGDFLLELIAFATTAPGGAPDRAMNEPGLTHLSLSVDDLDAAAALVPRLGGEVLVTLPNALMIRDPDGQRIEVLTMAYHQWAEGLRRDG